MCIKRLGRAKKKATGLAKQATKRAWMRSWFARWERESAEVVITFCEAEWSLADSLCLGDVNKNGSDCDRLTNSEGTVKIQRKSY